MKKVDQKTSAAKYKPARNYHSRQTNYTFCVLLVVVHCARMCSESTSQLHVGKSCYTVNSGMVCQKCACVCADTGEEAV